jgi:D-glycero-D-manno-heptose 1,7-bisphosphate phosphatase
MNKAFFLDRDGVVNEVIKKKLKPYPPKNIKEFKFCRGIKKFIDIYKKNYKIFVFTNQPDFKRGKITKSCINNINNHVIKKLKIDELVCCFHDDNDNCSCRKPKIGMLNYLKKKYSLNMRQSFVIGDRWSDILCGQKAGCKTIYIDRCYNEKKPKNYNFKFKNISSLIKGLNEKKI